MKIEMTTESGKMKKRLEIHGDRIAVNLPKDRTDPLLIQATIDEDSPIQIVVQNGVRQIIPVRQLRLVNSKTYLVKGFNRKTKAGIVHIPTHHRRMPVRKLRDTHKSI